MRTIIIIATLTFSSFDGGQKDKLIYEGDKFGDIELGKSTADDVFKIFGTKNKLINHDNYSTEIKYKDFSFTYKNSDKSKTIDWISFEPGSDLKTTKGLKLQRQLTVSDVIKIYGQPNWYYTTDSTELSFTYTGIWFDVKPNKHWTEKYYSEYGVSEKGFDSLHTILYFDKRVIDITIEKE